MSASMNTSEQILFLLKMRGPQTAQQLAALLDITSMGARRQLETALERGLVAFEDVADKVGRPSRRWTLTREGHARFPDRHADLTLELIAQVKTLFGDEGLDKLIGARERSSEAAYGKLVDPQLALAQRVDSLARARDGEGTWPMRNRRTMAVSCWWKTIVRFARPPRHARISAARSWPSFNGYWGAIARWSAANICWRGRRCVYRIIPIGV